MKEKSIDQIIADAIAGNEIPFNKFVEHLSKELLPKLTGLTKSETEAKNVFIFSMQKFWERFVMDQEALPVNIPGYIFMMCKNAWLIQKRSKWNLVALTEELDTHPQISHSSIPISEDQYKEDEKNEWINQKALTLALENISSKCRTLIESELGNKGLLKDLQKELGFTSYQAIVQAKYNCKKRLVKEVFRILKGLKNL